MGKQPSTPLQAATLPEETPHAPLEELARASSSFDSQVKEVFSWGYSAWNDTISDRSILAFSKLKALGPTRVSPQVVEAAGKMSGLTDRLYMRRDAAEHSSSIAIAAWAQRLANVLDVERLYQDLTAVPVESRKPTAKAAFDGTLQDHPDLEDDLNQIIATSHARLSAEGTNRSWVNLEPSQRRRKSQISTTHIKPRWLSFRSLAIITVMYR